MKRGVVLVTALAALTAPAEARTPTLTFKQAHSVLAGMAQSDGSGSWTIRDCHRRSRVRIDCRMDEYEVYSPMDGEYGDMPDQPLSVRRNEKWGRVIDLTGVTVIDYRKRL